MENTQEPSCSGFGPDDCQGSLSVFSVQRFLCGVNSGARGHIAYELSRGRCHVLCCRYLHFWDYTWTVKDAKNL